jgi:uncharacterized protein involved in response to NO
MSKRVFRQNWQSVCHHCCNVLNTVFSQVNFIKSSLLPSSYSLNIYNLNNKKLIYAKLLIRQLTTIFTYFFINAKRCAMMQITDLQKEQQIHPLFRLGFRAFFLGGAIFSIFALSLWLLFLRGYLSLSPLGGGYWWHIHEMIFGFGAAIIAGFLLTAVQNWTGLPSVKGKILMAIFSLWLIGRVLVLRPDLLGNNLTIMIDLSFLPIVAYVLAKPIIAVKQYRNLFFIPLLTLFTLANLEMHLALLYPEIFNIRYAGYAGVLLTTCLMSIMAGRVTPMFTANGTKTAKATAIPWLDNITNGSLVVCMLMMLLHPLLSFNSTAFGVLLMIAGLSQLARWLRWRPWITLGVPLLWSLHSSLKFVCLGLIFLGISYLVPDVPSNHIWHLLTIGGIGGIILAMISRVSLGHTGRTLSPPRAISLAFVFIILATLLRTFGPWGFPQHSTLFMEYSGIAWLLAYTIFVFSYGPMLLKARIDGRPG